MDQESSQTSSATKPESKARMTLDKHLALEALVKEQAAQIEALSAALPVAAKSEVKDYHGLQLQVDVLEEAFIKIATMSGHGNYLAEFGFKAWVPEAKDMKKYTG